jgi:hypothetical protein
MKRKLTKLTCILAALAVVWFARPTLAEARGGGGGGCGGARPRPRPSATGGIGGGSTATAAERSDRPSEAANRRITINWRDFKLSQPAESGYGETAAPLEVLVARAASQAEGQAPSLVLIYDEEATRQNAAVDKCLANQQVAVALKRFVCLKASGSKQASLERDLTVLGTHEKKVLEDEKKLLESCALRPEFIEEESAPR